MQSGGPEEDATDERWTTHMVQARTALGNEVRFLMTLPLRGVMLT